MSRYPFISRVPEDRLGDYRYLTEKRKMLGADALEMILSGSPLPARKKNVGGVPTVMAADVIGRVLNCMCLTENDFKSKSRSDIIISARAVVAVVLREAGGSYAWIAQRLGLKDHSTAIHLVKTFPKRAQRIPGLEAVKLYAAAVNMRNSGVNDLSDDEPEEVGQVRDHYHIQVAIEPAPQIEDADMLAMKRMRQRMVAGSALLLDAIKTARHA